GSGPILEKVEESDRLGVGADGNLRLIVQQDQFSIAPGNQHCARTSHATRAGHRPITRVPGASWPCACLASGVRTAPDPARRGVGVPFHPTRSMYVAHGSPELLEVQLKGLLSLCDPGQSLAGGCSAAGGPLLLRHWFPGVGVSLRWNRGVDEAARTCSLAGCFVNHSLQPLPLDRLPFPSGRFPCVRHLAWRRSRRECRFGTHVKACPRCSTEYPDDVRYCSHD